MLLSLVGFITLGILTGIITGLIPGIHVNLICVLIITASSFLLTYTSTLNLTVWILSLAITHSFMDVLPSIYLGAPDEAQALNVLPGHRLLQQGLGHSAIIYTVIGSLGALILGTIFFPLFIASIDFIYPLVRNFIAYFLIIIVVLLILREKGKRTASLLAFLLAGCLGLAVFRLPQLDQPLFPLLSGLFGVSLLLTSFFQNVSIPKQAAQQTLSLSLKNGSKAISAATGMGFIAAFLPGFGSSQAAITATAIVGDIGDEGFLTLVGGINTANMLLSLATALILDKARNGAVVAIKELIGVITSDLVILFIGVALIAGSIATLLTLAFSRNFAKNIQRVPYKTTVLTIVLFITTLSIIFDGLYGIIILVTATALGLVTSHWNVGKNHLMGCLLFPVILYFIL